MPQAGELVSTHPVVAWLLDEEDPGVAHLARRDLLGEPPGSPRMGELAGRVNRHPPVARMLERADEALEAGLYRKYQGFGWSLIFLAELGCDGRDPRARRLAEAVLATQLDSGGFAPSGSARWEIVCLTANLLRALVCLGYGDEPAVVRGYRRLTERILEHGGVPCRVIDEHTARSCCRMTVPQTLRALAAAPSSAGGGIARTAELLAGQLREMRVYQYLRPDLRAYRQAVRLPPKGERPRGLPVADFKEAWRAEHPVAPEEWLPKPGWLRFGFPSSYNPDLLEAMLALVEHGAPAHASYEDALRVIESKRGPDGRWRMERSLNGKMLADVERKGAPSKWVTLRALTVLRHFGRAAAEPF